MILQQCVDQEPWTERDRGDQKDECLAIEPPQRSAEEEKPTCRHRGNQENAPADPGDRAIKENDWRPVRQHKAVPGDEEQTACFPSGSVECIAVSDQIASARRYRLGAPHLRRGRLLVELYQQN